MSFTVSVKAETRTVFPQLGIYKDTGVSNIDVVYTLKSVCVNADKSATAIFSIEIADGAQGGEVQFGFTYTGSGDPREEAEKSLKSSLL
ncbi:hypothetical protein [Klebsiella michiganensis]|uniref:hypothetical protein n=1 Tax=Klebsiella michiganensis TaxID=1134687 RepID=UPI003B98236E